MKLRLKTILVLTFFIIVLLGVGYMLIVWNTDRYLGRYVAWKASDVKDYERFPSEVIKKAPPLYNFPQSEDAEFGKMLISYEKKDKKVSADLDTLLSESDTTAFVVLKDNALVYEGYFNGYERGSINTSFSVAKSVTSILIGIAIDEGLIKSVHDPVTKYIPELQESDERFSEVTIEYLLSMKSGISYRDHDLPWGDKAISYYHPNLRERVLELTIDKTPGETFQYNNYNPIILGMVLERVTGKSVPKYLEEKIWSKMGMEYDASWSLDSSDSRMAKMESGINARAIDYAKLGQLVLNNGLWEEEAIVSEKWIEELFQTTSENKVPFYGENLYYNRGWWLTEESETSLRSIAATGHLGQYLYIFPDEKIVIVRFGKSQGGIDSWPDLMHSVAKASRSEYR